MARSEPPRTLTSETISLALQQSHKPTHFDCIAAPDDSSEALVLAVQPCGVLLASPARLHWVWVGAADWHSNSAGSSSIGDASGHSRQNVVAVSVGLVSPVSIQFLFWQELVCTHRNRKRAEVPLPSSAWNLVGDALHTPCWCFLICSLGLVRPLRFSQPL